MRIRPRNAGSADAKIELVFLTGKPYTDYTGVTQSGLINATLKPGEVLDGVVSLPKTGRVWMSGMSVEVMIQTVAGRQYPKTMMLP